MGISYLLMLIAMTFNIYLFLAVILGAGLGHLLFGWRRTTVLDYNEHCHWRAPRMEMSVVFSMLWNLILLFASSRIWSNERVSSWLDVYPPPHTCRSPTVLLFSSWSFKKEINFRNPPHYPQIIAEGLWALSMPRANPFFQSSIDYIYFSFGCWMADQEVDKSKTKN